MKNLRTVLVAFAAITFLAAACGSDEGVKDEPDPAASNERIETLWVGPQLVDCVGAFPQTCLQVRRSVDGQVEYFYDSIQGFEHEPGTSYVLRVAVSDVEDPPADGSSLSYRLVEVVESSSEPAAANLDGTSWLLLGFRDGDLFDPVPDDVEISIAFDGDRVSGSAGCNNYMGGFSAEGDQLSFGPLTSTRMLCPPEIMNHEDHFLTIMATVETAEVTFDDRLVLRPSSGLTLVLVRS